MKLLAPIHMLYNKCNIQTNYTIAMAAMGFDPHQLTTMIKNMALPAAKAQAANQTRQANLDKEAKKRESEAKSSRGGDVGPSSGITADDLPPSPLELLPTSEGTIEDGYRLVWEDQFESDTLNTSNWQIEVDCRAQELQCYTAKPWNIYQKAGRLFIHARVHTSGYTPADTSSCTRSKDCMLTKQYTSGRLRTKGLHSWKYGRVEIRARMPSGPFLWPTLWMLPTNDVHGNWAASGEIDIIETTGNQPSAFSSTIHFGGVAPLNKFESSGVQSLMNDRNVIVDLSDRFHLYRLDWTENRLQTFVDGQMVLDIDLDRSFGDMYKKTAAPFDEEFFLIMNVAVGGEFFGADVKNLTTALAKNWTRPFMEIDYVRVFERDPLVNDKQAQDVGTTAIPLES